MTFFLRLDWTVAPAIPTRRAYGSAISSGVSKADGKEYIAYGHGKIVYLRPADNFNQVVTFTQHKANVTVVSISPDGSLVGSGDDTGCVMIWDLNEKQEVKTQYQIGSCVQDIRWSKDSKKFVAGGDSGSEYAKAYPVGKTNAIGKFDRITKKVLSLDWSPKEDVVVTADENRDVNFYKGPIFKHAGRSNKHLRYPNVVRFSPDGSVFITAGSDAKLHVYNGSTGEHQRVIESKDNGHTASIYGMAWMPDGKSVATAGGDKTVKVWNVEAGAVTASWSVAGGLVDLDDVQVGLTVLTDGRIATASLSGAVKVYDVSTTSGPVATYVSPANNGAIVGLEVSPCQSVLYVAESQGRISAVETKDGTTSWFGLSGGKQLVPVNTIALSCDGSKLYAGMSNNSLVVCDVAKGTKDSNGNPLAMGPSLITFEAGVLCLATSATSPDLVAAVLRNRKLVLLHKGTILAEAECPAGSQIAFCPDDSEIAVAADTEKVVRFYSWDGSKLAFSGASADETGNNCSAVAYSKAANIVVASQNNQINVFDSSRGGSVALGWVFHNAKITALRFSPDGGALLSTSLDCGACIWTDFVKFTPKPLQLNKLSSQGILFAQWVSSKSFVVVDADYALRKYTLVEQQA